MEPWEEIPPPEGTTAERPTSPTYPSLAEVDGPDEEQAAEFAAQARAEKVERIARDRQVWLEGSELGQQRYEQAKRDAASQDAQRNLLSWQYLLSTDFGAVQFLTDPLLQPGGMVSLVGDGKVGKSLLCWEWACRLANGHPFLNTSEPPDPMVCGYVDQENPHSEIQRRARTTGYDTPELLANLYYASYPDFGPLDSPVGAASLIAWVLEYKIEVLWLDTISRMIAGKENDSDTWLQLYRLTLQPLRAAGVSIIRLDHYGKDQSRGSRGSSAKSQDIDHEWTMTRTPGARPNLFQLRRTYTRSGIGDSLLTVERTGNPTEWGTTSHVITRPPTPAETQHWLQVVELARLLDTAGVPRDAGRRVVATELASMNRGIRAELAGEVARVRRTGEHLDLVDDSQEWVQETFPINPETNR